MKILFPFPNERHLKGPHALCTNLNSYKCLVVKGGYHTQNPKIPNMLKYLFFGFGGGGIWGNFLNILNIILLCIVVCQIFFWCNFFFFLKNLKGKEKKLETQIFHHAKI
jgi:hypothetical protein